MSERRADNDTGRILVVDDEPSVLRALSRVLRGNGYECDTAPDGEAARLLLDDHEYAVVLTDMDMPGTTGLDLIQEVATRQPDTATLMVTGVDDTSLASTALDMGAYGYIIKPFEPNEILINVANTLRRRALEIENRNHRTRLEEMVRERTEELWNAITGLEHAEKELRASQEETVHRLSLAAEYRDDETARHIKRMSRYCALIAMSKEGDAQYAEKIRVASVMHDVGKIGIPDSILQKPGKLTPEEYETMKEHADIGHHILADSSSEMLQLAASIAWTHHERMDGTGYPRGLKGLNIPLEGRLAAIADVFDALTTNRVYRRAYPLGEALDIMKAGRGSHFDDDLLGLFLDSIDQVLTIKQEHDE